MIPAPIMRSSRALPGYHSASAEELLQLLLFTFIRRPLEHVTTDILVRAYVLTYVHTTSRSVQDVPKPQGYLNGSGGRRHEATVWRLSVANPAVAFRSLEPSVFSV